MSAASPKVQDKTQEPSMEEILASIRRIIADDQAPKPAEAEAPQPPPAPPPLPEDDDDVLDLAEVAEPVRKPEPKTELKPDPMGFDIPEIDFRMPDFDPEPEPVFEASAPDPFEFEPEAAPTPKVSERIRAAVEEEATERLVSSRTVESVGQNFQLLAQTVLSQNARTLEDLVQEMLRPMLKSWLDDNLPLMVERLVRVEIERVARGR